MSTTEYFVYLEPWLDETALSERFNIDRKRIIVRYESFLLVKLRENEEIALKNAGVIVTPTPDKKKIKFGDHNNTRTTFSSVEPISDPEKPLVWIVQFVGPIKQNWIDALHKLGVQTHGYIQPYSIFAYMPLTIIRKLKDENLKVQEEKVIEWIGRYHQNIKIHSECTGQVVVHYFPWKKNNTCCHKCICTKEVNPRDMAQSEGVIYIHPHIDPKICNSEARTVLKSDIAHAQGITGVNEVIAITDTGIYRAHEMFSNISKILTTIDIAGDSSGMGGDGDGHGTHVAGSVAGDAPGLNAWNKEDGEGYAAKLIAVKVFSNDGDWVAGDNEYNFWKQAYLAGAKINNNSWGADSNGSYLSTDYDADQICTENPEYILAVANGNAGPAAETVGSPAVAKNVISVGACVTRSPNDLASFSSRGPTNDGRIKPDIVAPGTTITSALSQTVNGYVDMQGTSMATPQIAGVSALVRQYFKEGKYPVISGSHNPSSALVKAMLINGAVEMTGIDADRQGELKFPNNSQGWGRVDISRTLPFGTFGRIVKAWDIASAPSTGSKWTTSFTVDSATVKEVKITLVWIDPSAVAGSSVTLVNNYNLRILTPDNKTFLGNNFKGINPGYSMPGGTFDSRNNVEGVHLLSSYSFGSGVSIPQGQYTLEVISTYTSSINKGFALVVGIENTIVAPPFIQNRAAVMGDYNDQLAAILKLEGYVVDSYTSTDYGNLVANVQSYKVLLLNRVNDVSGFNSLLTAAGSSVGIVFLGSYPITGHALGVLSKRTGNPLSADNKWSSNPVKVKVLTTHPIFNGYTANTTLTIINGGDNDYQTYNKFTGSNIGANAMTQGLPFMVGVQNIPKRVLLGSLGVSNYTNVTHWTSQGRTLFINSVAWAANLPTKS